MCGCVKIQTHVCTRHLKQEKFERWSKTEWVTLTEGWWWYAFVVQPFHLLKPKDPATMKGNEWNWQKHTRCLDTKENWFVKIRNKINKIHYSSSDLIVVQTCQIVESLLWYKFSLMTFAKKQTFMCSAFAFLISISVVTDVTGEVPLGHTPLTPSARISALNIVGDLLRKVGVSTVGSFKLFFKCTCWSLWKSCIMECTCLNFVVFA